MTDYLKITFEDHGQDFEDWYLRREGAAYRVIDCQPFQGFVWVDAIVYERPKVGECLRLTTRSSPTEPRTLNYAVESIEKVADPAEIEQLEGYYRKWMAA